MALERLQRVVSGESKGTHFAAVLFMGPLAALAILALRQLDLVARSPIWLVPAILVGGQLCTTATGLWRVRRPTRLRLHVWIASQSILVTATIYAIGWGPALAIGLVLVGQESLAVVGTDAERAILGWTLGCLAAGQGSIALGWAPTLVPVPEVHGLAVLMGIGIAFSYRSLRSALIDREQAAALTESHERRFRALVQSSSDLVFAVGVGGQVTYASPSCRATLGYEPDLLLGSESGGLVHPDDIEELRATFGRVVSVPGGSVEFCIRVRHENGSWCWLEGLATNLLEDPAVEGMVINARDITGRRARLERQTAISDLGREMLRATTFEESVASASQTVEAILHARACRIVGVAPGADGLAAGPGDDARVAGAADGTGGPALCVAVGDPAQPLGFIEVDRDGPTTVEDEQFVESVAGIVLATVVRFRAEDAIRHQAMHDPLTGLPNRALFNDRLEHALQRRQRTRGHVAVMIVDLDGFKNVNDSLGHLAGDALLVAVARRFTDTLRGFDTIARLGGDEFAILFDGLEATDQAARIAQRVLDALVRPLPLPEREVAIGASVGIALSDGDDTDAGRLLADADAAMYRAKREGKGCYRVFEAAMHTAAVERMNLEQELRTAIRDHALGVHYQPIVDAATGRVVSFEALARWHYAGSAVVPPGTFIPLAEESGLIIDLGRAVLMEACLQARRWRDVVPHDAPRLSVNASRLQLASSTFSEHVAEALAASGLDASSLVIEVTESILASESGTIMANLDALRRAGAKVAIDDFGTGYSSFAALAELPIDILKIDKRFIDNLVFDEQGRGFVTAIMQLAHTLHLEITAEGVESAEQRSALAALGCTYLQGYFFARPMTGEETHDFLDRQSGAHSSPGVLGGAPGHARIA